CLITWSSLFIFLNCITIALERPGILPHSTERVFLSVSNYVFTIIFLAEMTVKIVALGGSVGQTELHEGSWNVLDGILVFVSLVDILVSLAWAGGNRILGILQSYEHSRLLTPPHSASQVGTHYDHTTTSQVDTTTSGRTLHLLGRTTLAPHYNHTMTSQVGPHYWHHYDQYYDLS
ncbi:voltage-dependent T-type calcium channel subunit alpha-1I-like, partial [Oncorhynchus keta]|uniref:voltage-dependent T-type calcium channel subunit alpha-1I-like n=1 Tax=Oncorhynchus keta TaxID=8018 RepID=UPI00227B2874